MRRTGTWRPFLTSRPAARRVRVDRVNGRVARRTRLATVDDGGPPPPTATVTHPGLGADDAVTHLYAAHYRAWSGWPRCCCARRRPPRRSSRTRSSPMHGAWRGWTTRTAAGLPAALGGQRLPVRAAPPRGGGAPPPRTVADAPGRARRDGRDRPPASRGRRGRAHAVPGCRSASARCSSCATTPTCPRADRRRAGHQPGRREGHASRAWLALRDHPGGASHDRPHGRRPRRDGGPAARRPHPEAAWSTPTTGSAHPAGRPRPRRCSSWPPALAAAAAVAVMAVGAWIALRRRVAHRRRPTTPSRPFSRPSTPPGASGTVGDRLVDPGHQAPGSPSVAVPVYYVALRSADGKYAVGCSPEQRPAGSDARADGRAASPPPSRASSRRWTASSPLAGGHHAR